MAAANQNHPLAIVADTSIIVPPSHQAGGLCFRKSVVHRGSESSDTPPSPGAQ